MLCAMAEPALALDDLRSRVEQERLRALVTSIGLGVLVEDEQRRVAVANEAFCEFFSIPASPEQLVGADCAEAALAVVPLVVDSAAWLARIAERLAGRVAAIGDEIQLVSGRILECDYVPIAVDSVRRGHLWLYRDVTQSRKHAQLERAAAVRDELRVAIDTIPGLVWSAQPNGQIELFNQRWREYTGLDLAADSWTWEAMIAPEDFAEFQARISEAWSASAPVEAEARLRRFDGQHRWFLFRAVPLIDRSGRTSRWYGQAIDVDDRKRSEEALQHAQNELSRVARVTTLGELAASIAHEINQPISAMVADASACLNRLNAAQPDLGKVRESLEAIVSDGARAGEVLTRIRALLARSEIAHQPCSVDDVIRRSVALARAELGRHGFAIDLHLNAGSSRVIGDEVELQQVVLNLLLNAIEAARELPPARRHVAIQSEVEERGDHRVVTVSVRDWGSGIDPAIRARLFSPFQTTKPGGLGMGLSIIRSIIERHQGRISARESADVGAAFEFWLPLSG
jgi:PAS domain S-box-containing protein